MKAKGIERGRVIFMAYEPWYNSDPHMTFQNMLVGGIAYSFKKGCEPAPYRVYGGYDERANLVLKGAAPVWTSKGCEISGNSTDAPGSTLVFEMFYDE